MADVRPLEISADPPKEWYAILRSELLMETPLLFQPRMLKEHLGVGSLHGVLVEARVKKSRRGSDNPSGMGGIGSSTILNMTDMPF